MKKIVVVWLLIFGLFSVSLAQSGRRIAPTPTPTPSIDETGELPYSESTPQKRRSLYNTNIQRDKTVKQDIQTQTQVNVPQADASAEVDNEVLNIETNLITIPVSVFDRNGLYIPNLKQEDFKIFEDGKEQEIAYFGTSEKPFTVILLLDTSPSTEYKIEEIRAAAVAFVNQLKPQDSVMVIEFDGNVHVLSEPTNDRQKLFKAIKRADFGWGTSLYDAVQFSLRKRLSKIEGRKAIVLFTDGVDTASTKANYDSTIREAEEADSMIFPIYYNTFFDTNNNGSIFNSPFPFPSGGLPAPGTTAREYAIGRQYLDDLSAVTGGRVFRPDSTPGGLTRAFEGIAEELRRQYNVGYYPQESGKVGQRKQIKVRVNHPNLVIRARDSYIVGANVKPQATTTTKPK